MGLSADQLRTSLNALAAIDAALARGLAAAGHPEPRISPPGYPTLLRTIIGQQVSVHSARATWDRLSTTLGTVADPASLLAATDAHLRGAGLSRQKASYARSLAGLVTSGELLLDQLPADDEAAIEALIRVKGIGRWSAEIYLLFSEGRPDIWPAGDLAVQIAIGDILGLPQRPTEQATRSLAETWRPHRGAAAIFAWHHYTFRARAAKTLAPL